MAAYGDFQSNRHHGALTGASVRVLEQAVLTPLSIREALHPWRVPPGRGKSPGVGWERSSGACPHRQQALSQQRRYRCASSSSSSSSSQSPSSIQQSLSQCVLSRRQKQDSFSFPPPQGARGVPAQSLSPQVLPSASPLLPAAPWGRLEGLEEETKPSPKPGKPDWWRELHRLHPATGGKLDWAALGAQESSAPSC